jgi:hypothetical protein
MVMSHWQPLLSLRSFAISDRERRALSDPLANLLTETGLTPAHPLAAAKPIPGAGGRAWARATGDKKGQGECKKLSRSHSIGCSAARGDSWPWNSRGLNATRKQTTDTWVLERISAAQHVSQEVSLLRGAWLCWPPFQITRRKRNDGHFLPSHGRFRGNTLLHSACSRLHFEWALRQ